MCRLSTSSLDVFWYLNLSLIPIVSVDDMMWSFKIKLIRQSVNTGKNNTGKASEAVFA
jgi:hypothetical protein